MQKISEKRASLIEELTRSCLRSRGSRQDMTSNYWLTFKQIQSLGWHVKGHIEMVVF